MCCVVLKQVVGGDAVIVNVVIIHLVCFCFVYSFYPKRTTGFAQDDCNSSQLRDTKVAY